jgi:hypothetical protein
MRKLLDKIGCFMFSYLVFICPGQVWMSKNTDRRFIVTAVGKSYVICKSTFSAGSAKYVFSRKEFRRSLFLTI